MDEQTPVLTERHGHVLVITLNRPRARNAVNAELAQALGEALSELDADPELRVGVLTGAGDRAFCAGADLKELAAGRSIGPRTAQWGFGGIVRRELVTPLVAAVNGLALGGGTEIALCCDVVVAAESASFGLPEVRRGIVAAAGGLIRLPQMIPVKRALELAMTGEPVGAAEAERLGLVNRVAPDGEVLEVALRLAQRVAANAPLAVAASREVILGSAGRTAESEAAAWALSDRASADVRASEDAREGVTAFAEHREPSWRGR